MAGVTISSPTPADMDLMEHTSIMSRPASTADSRRGLCSSKLKISSAVLEWWSGSTAEASLELSPKLFLIISEAVDVDNSEQQVISKETPLFLWRGVHYRL